jgi:predicted DsbA family dithiol-disulfide isomerase
LNPNVSPEGESLDEYLLRDYGFSKEYAHSKDYPLYQQGLAAGVQFNPTRRVLNTFDAFCMIELAEEQGLQTQVVEDLSRRSFEGAQNISDHSVLVQESIR